MGKHRLFQTCSQYFSLDEGRRSGDEVASLSHVTIKTVVDKTAIK